jgi:hypothetical protein
MSKHFCALATKGVWFARGDEVSIGRTGEKFDLVFIFSIIFESSARNSIYEKAIAGTLM